MQVHDPNKGQNVTLDRSQAVMGVGRDLIVGHPLEPQLDYPSFVGLATPDAVQVAPAGQIAALGVQEGKISFDGAHGNGEGTGQVFLGGNRALFEGFGQQSLDPHLT